VILRYAHSHRSRATYHATSPRRHRTAQRRKPRAIAPGDLLAAWPDVDGVAFFAHVEAEASTDLGKSRAP
jgi:hypothetical protein